MKHLIEFSKAYNFEDKVYRNIDISAIEVLTGKMLMAIESKFETMCTANNYFFNLPEKSALFASMLCAEMCELPYEFFDGLPAKDLRQIATHIYHFFYFEDTLTVDEPTAKQAIETTEA